jgi:hypothetical protein
VSYAEMAEEVEQIVAERLRAQGATGHGDE